MKPLSQDLYDLAETARAMAIAPTCDLRGGFAHFAHLLDGAADRAEELERAPVRASVRRVPLHQRILFGLTKLVIAASA